MVFLKEPHHIILEKIPKGFNELEVVTIRTRTFQIPTIPRCFFHLRFLHSPSCWSWSSTTKLLFPSSLFLVANSQSNFSDSYSNTTDPYQANLNPISNWAWLTFQHVVFMNCSHPVTYNRKYVDTAPCVNSDSKGYYIYSIAGDLKAHDFEVGCHVKLVAFTSWWGLDTNNYSYTAMHTGLVYGFEISWMHLTCVKHCRGNYDCYCHFDSFFQKLQWLGSNFFQSEWNLK